MLGCWKKSFPIHRGSRPRSVWASDGIRHATLLQACGALGLPFDRLVVRDRQLGAVALAALVGVAWLDALQLPAWSPPTAHCQSQVPTPRVCGPACSPRQCRNTDSQYVCRLRCATAPGVLLRDWAPPPRLAVPMVRRRKTVPEWIAPPDERIEPSANDRPCALTTARARAAAGAAAAAGAHSSR